MNPREDGELGGCYQGIGLGSRAVPASGTRKRPMQSLQQEWQFLQHVTNRLGHEFEGIEQALHWDFLPALFSSDLVNNIPRQLACLPVKKAGLAILNPITRMESNWTASTVICGHLVVAIQGTEEFRSADHSAIMAAGKVKTQARCLIES